MNMVLFDDNEKPLIPLYLGEVEDVADDDEEEDDMDTEEDDEEEEDDDEEEDETDGIGKDDKL